MTAMQGSPVWVDGTHFSAQSVAIIVVLLDFIWQNLVVSDERAVWEWRVNNQLVAGGGRSGGYVRAYDERILDAYEERLG